MLGLSYEDIIEKIVKETAMSRAVLEKKIEDKIKQLSDLISREGAAQIIANQLGVKLVESFGSKSLKLKEIPKGTSSVNFLARVIQIYGVREFNKEGRIGKVANLLIGDETGSLRMVIWDDKLIKELENGAINEGDVIKVSNAYSRVNNNFNELHLGSRAVININPDGEKIPEIQGRVSVLEKFESVKISELKEGMQVELNGTVVQLFEPRHYLACPHCNKKVFQQGLEYKCNTHDVVEPKKSPIVNMFFDDGSGNVRVVLFANQAMQLLNKTSEEIVNTNNEKIELFKKDVLGKQMLISGRVIRNQMMDRLEIISSNVKEANPVELIQMYEK
ncbi:hypothetical protein J4438_01600 [Candidatus Woesearchaeota archaeon]|nr:hypothetical protein [Candidatus Woesearchaeota archaeon]